MDANSIHVDELDANSVDVDFDLEDVDNTKNDSRGHKPKRKRKQTFDVLRHFELLPLGLNGKQKARCKVFNLKQHTISCVQRKQHDSSQLMLSQDSGDISLGSSKFDPEVLRDLVTKLIVMHDLPFQFVEYVGIRNILTYLHPEIPLLSRNTVKADIIKMYKKERDAVKSLLKIAPGKVSFTSDLWSSLTTDGYLCLTCHFVDDNWNLQKKILSFTFMPPAHNEVALFEKIHNLLCEWGLEAKVFSITLDNASSNDVFVGMLKTQLNLKGVLVCDGDHFHMRCYAHILNLIVQDELKVLDSSIFKIRESIKYVKGSHVRKQKFLEYASLVSNENKKGLCQDVSTRWDSTYLMLQSALYYRQAFQHMELSDSNYQYSPSREEWEKLEKFNSLLKVLYDSTLMFSSTKYPTSNLYFPAVFVCYMELRRRKDVDDEYLRAVANRMWLKFEKYWCEFSTTLAIACLLDPRYKMNFVSFVYTKIYGEDSLEFRQFNSKLQALFEAYKSMASIQTSSSNFLLNNDVDVDHEVYDCFASMDDAFKEFDEISSNEFGSKTQKSQLELYLDEPIMRRNVKLDILSFWKSNQFCYPNLASMARDILSIQVSTFASESFFSIGGRVLDQCRASLTPKTIEAFICLQDWVHEGKTGNADKMDLEELPHDVLKMSTSENSSSSSCPKASNSC